MASIKGAVSGSCSLSGSVSVPSGANVEKYTGEYEVTPSASDKQVLLTANKLLTKNVTVEAVPYYEVSNTSNGKTVYIASKV